MSQVVAGLIGGLVGYSLAREKPPTDIEIVNFLCEGKPTLFKAIPLDTSSARENEEFPVTGSLLFVENPDTPSLPVYVRLNEPDAEKIDLTASRKIKAPFYRLFITNAVGTGTLNLIICKTSVVEFAEAVVNMKITAQTADLDINVVAADIMMPMDLQASYIMMPVDIQASYVTLDINIKAKEVTLTIDIEAQHVGIYLQPEWAALQGIDKVFNSEGLAKGWGGYCETVYNVPTGKKVYLVGGCFQIASNVIAEYDHLFYGRARIHKVLKVSPFTVVNLAYWGGVGGGAVNFAKPIAIDDAYTLKTTLHNQANLDADQRITVWGYEL